MLKRFFLRYRRVFVIIVNIFFITAAYIAAFYLRFEFSLPAQYHRLIVETLPVLLAIKLISFFSFGLFRGLWKYVSIGDVGQILKANSIASGVFIFYLVFFRGLAGFPRSILVLDWGICIGLLTGARFLSRALREKIIPRKYDKTKKVLIFGAGEAGVLVLDELKKNMRYEVVGFIDDAASKKGMAIKGKRILGGRESIKHIVDSCGVEEIILAMPSQEGRVIRDVVTHCKVPGVGLKIVPGMYKILSGELDVKFRDVQPEDLLGRESVEIDRKEVSACLKGKRVLVTGAAGSIGAELCRQIASFSPSCLILFDLNENDMYLLELELREEYPALNIVMVMGDVRDIGLLKHVFSKNKPQLIFHAAAYKHVPMMEVIPSAAIKNNAIATRNLIYAAGHYRVERFVYISTDKAVCPTSIMGITKRIGEMLIQAKDAKSPTKFMAVRFGNVLGSQGSVVPLFKRQISKGGPVTVTHPEAQRYFMSASEAAGLVLQAGALGRGGEIFVLDMGQRIKIYDLAVNLITLSGFRPHQDIEITFRGLRPGEKLSEDALHDEEKDRATKNNRIFVTAPESFPIKKLIRDIKELENLAKVMNEESILRKIEEMVPKYDAFGNRQ